MQITSIEHDILTTVHRLPIDKQKEILDFSLFLQNRTDIAEKSQPSQFSSSLQAFLEEAKATPLHIEMDIFERDKAISSGRDFQI